MGDVIDVHQALTIAAGIVVGWVLVGWLNFFAALAESNENGGWALMMGVYTIALGLGLTWLFVPGVFHLTTR